MTKSGYSTKPGYVAVTIAVIALSAAILEWVRRYVPENNRHYETISLSDWDNAREDYTSSGWVVAAQSATDVRVWIEKTKYRTWRRRNAEDGVFLAYHHLNFSAQGQPIEQDSPLYIDGRLAAIREANAAGVSPERIRTVAMRGLTMTANDKASTGTVLRLMNQWSAAISEVDFMDPVRLRRVIAAGNDIEVYHNIMSDTETVLHRREWTVWTFHVRLLINARPALRLIETDQMPQGN